MFGLSARYAFAPHSKRARLHLFAHQRNDLWFRKAIVHIDRFKGGAVFPGHFDNSADVTVVHSVFRVSLTLVMIAKFDCLADVKARFA